MKLFDEPVYGVRSLSVNIKALFDETVGLFQIGNALVGKPEM